MTKRVPFSVNRNDSQTLVAQVADGLRQAIVSGYYKVGEVLPSSYELAMGAFYVTPELGKQCADAFLYNDFGSGWEWWPDFDKFHQIAIDELNAFNYDEYKANGFKVKHLGDCHCELYDRPEGFSSVPLMCKR